MSLHAQLSPEALARLHAQRRNSTISSVAISFLSITLMGLILGFILLPNLFKETPTIVTYAASVTEDTDLNEKKINTSTDRRPSSPSSSRAKVIAANTTSTVAIPVPDIDTPVPSVNFGDGDDFGTGWGSGDGDGGGGGGFGNIPATMKKRCSQADRLSRLKETGGTPECEEAVVKGLKWLKSTQSADGSWGGGPPTTGLALLAYLGHCETPLSQEFGDSCLRAITYLVNFGMKSNGQLTNQPGGHDAPYEHGIAIYALAEAATFCKQLKINVPNLQETTQKAGQFMIDSQHPSGGWEYAYSESGGRGGDLSISAWQIQALKACKHTGLDFRNLQQCANKASAYVEKLAAPSGAFGYSSAGDGGGRLTGAGMLCLQMWDKGSRAGVRNGAKFLDQNGKFDYGTASGDLYCQYYNAQAMINRGGEQWKRYNLMFRDQLLKNQNGDGSFKSPGGGMGPIRTAHYSTCFATLMLEVYYRFLPGTGGGVN